MFEIGDLNPTGLFAKSPLPSDPIMPREMTIGIGVVGVDQLQGEEGDVCSRVESGFVEFGDVRMLKLAKDLRFYEKPSPKGIVKTLMQDFQCHLSTGSVLFGLEHHTHASATQEPKDAIAGNIHWGTVSRFGSGRQRLPTGKDY